MSQVILALGSNLGDRAAVMERAVRRVLGARAPGNADTGNVPPYMHVAVSLPISTSCTAAL